MTTQTQPQLIDERLGARTRHGSFDMDQDSLRRTLLLEAHRSIDNAVAASLAMLESGRIELVYPPGAALTAPETAALAELRLAGHARAALEKILRDVAARPLFDLFALIDGVADPEEWKGKGPWLGATITERREGDAAMWHDELFESYWDYPGTRRPDV